MKKENEETVTKKMGKCQEKVASCNKRKRGGRNKQELNFTLSCQDK